MLESRFTETQSQDWPQGLQRANLAKRGPKDEPITV